MHVKKRNGGREALDLNKIHKVLTWACKGSDDGSLPPIRGVSVSEIEMRAQLQFFEGMTTRQIHECLIKAAADLISEYTPNYDRVAARLRWFAVRKEAFGAYTPPPLLEVVRLNTKRGLYDPAVLTMYSEAEWGQIGRMVKHSRDDLFRYAGAEQMTKKYLVQNRKTKKVYETFQIAYILIAAILFHKYPAEVRLGYVRRYYDALSQYAFSLPTPVMSGLRTKVKQFSSCTVMEAGDSLDSITATTAAIVDYASRKAGIGLGIGAIRAAGQPVRGGDAVTTGVIPFAKLFASALKSCSQGAVRGASGTFNYPLWHLEFDSLIELKNNKGTAETRLRTVDYCVHLNRTMYERLVDNGVITFFSPEEVPDLYQAFYGPADAFKTLYEQYEKNPAITKKQLPASEVFAKLVIERFETGRIYIMHADHVNTHSSFYEPIRLTNLCVEITLPTVPMGSPEARIALCTLSALNWGVLKSDEDLAEAAELVVRGLDALLDYQDYPNEAARMMTMECRPLGVGVIGFAHWLAKHKLRWGAEETLRQTEAHMEKTAYYLIKASNQLAKEQGACPRRTKYHDGVLPFETCTPPAAPQLDWTGLKADLLRYGIRNSTLMAGMPAETSSQLANETNGFEPPKALVSTKGGKDGVADQVVPDLLRLGPYYELAWDVSVPDYLRTIAVLQKYMDQSISTNTSYNPKKLAVVTPGPVDVADDPDAEHPSQAPAGVRASQLVSDLLLAYSLGLKTLYYCNTLDGSGDDDDEGCAGGACKL